MALVVTVVVEGGVVQSVEAPPGVMVLVRDYDVPEVDPDLVEQDEDGSLYVETVWGDDPTPAPNASAVKSSVPVMPYSNDIP